MTPTDHLQTRYTLQLAAQLRPFDILLYDRGAGFGLNTLIKLKTWSDVSHVGIVADALTGFVPRVISAFPATGVDVFDWDTGEASTGVIRVLRRTLPPTVEQQRAGLEWFVHAARGQDYDYVGMIAFFLAQAQGAQNRKMFCSEVVARYLKKAGVWDLHARVDADAVAPATFLLMPGWEIVWTCEEGWMG